MSYTVKIYIYITLIVILSLFLTGCTLNKEVENLYKKESPLEAEIIVPDSFSKDNKETIKVILTQNGERVEDADFVHFEIWKQDGSLSYNMEEAENVGNGNYSLTKDFNREGLYFIKVHASSGGSTIIPVKQFVVGELSKSDVDFLKKNVQQQNPIPNHHH